MHTEFFHYKSYFLFIISIYLYKNNINYLSIKNKIINQYPFLNTDPLNYFDSDEDEIYIKNNSNLQNDSYLLKNNQNEFNYFYYCD